MEFHYGRLKAKRFFVFYNIYAVTTISGRTSEFYKKKTKNIVFDQP